MRLHLPVEAERPSVPAVECPSCNTNDNLAVYCRPIEAMLGITSMDDSTVVASSAEVRMLNVGMETAELHCNNCGNRWKPGSGVTIEIQ
jgi:hypothetical protein